jgi:hypothetical protein
MSLTVKFKDFFPNIKGPGAPLANAPLDPRLTYMYTYRPYTHVCGTRGLRRLIFWSRNHSHNHGPKAVAKLSSVHGVTQPAGTSALTGSRMYTAHRGLTGLD